MLQHWTVGIWLCFAIGMPAHGQSGDSGDWGSGDIPEAVVLGNTSYPVLHVAGDDPAGTGNRDWSEPHLQVQPPANTDEECLLNFYTNPTLSRRLKAYREEVTYLKAIQHGNQAVIENLVQFVGAEMGDQPYQEVIQENIEGIREDHLSCDGVVQKAAEELESQLQGDILEALAGIQKIKEESEVFEEMLRTTANIANRIESSSRTLHLELSEQLRKSMRPPR